ncbi:GNAT family N-acetyltransferase [Marinospirillum sp.]|uniref:GNAT family N-acetyltransferase n=1 Tax=Marinospirillum sp. TaxID=2183934 RepID=UPI003A839EBC
MQIRPCDPQQDAQAILAIFNHAIEETTALYEYQPRSLEQIHAWLEQKKIANLPVLGVYSSMDTLQGFASYGPFRPWPAFQYTVEHSIYLHPKAQGQGLGRLLLSALIQAAEAQQYHVMVAAIDASNQASCALHRRLGFQPAGRLQQVGYKFGRWLDLDFYQLQLITPVAPSEAGPVR